MSKTCVLMCDITHNYPFILRQLETDCRTNYLIKDHPTKVGNEEQIFRDSSITPRHML